MEGAPVCHRSNSPVIARYRAIGSVFVTQITDMQRLGGYPGRGPASVTTGATTDVSLQDQSGALFSADDHARLSNNELRVDQPGPGQQMKSNW